MKTKLFITAISSLIFCAFTIQLDRDISRADWLIGTWIQKTSKGNVYETWVRKNATTFNGKSYMLKEKDSLIFETVQLLQADSRLFYIPTVKNQNNGLPVSFKEKKISETQLIFENLEHDFPQVISYTKITPDSLLAEISGIKNGKYNTRSFPMKRVK